MINFQYGFEIEYQLDEIAPLLKYYYPSSIPGLSVRNWNNLSDHERIEFVKTNLKLIFPQIRQKSHLTKTPNCPLEYLPDYLILDQTGNVELILNIPFTCFNQWLSCLSLLVNTLGAGSMQGTISLSHSELFFNHQGDALAKYIYSMLMYFSEYAMIEKLDAAYYKHLGDFDRITLGSWENAFLDPLNSFEANMLKKYLFSNCMGDLFDKESLEVISATDASFKYQGAITYRPDILGKERIIFEVREANKNFSVLVNRMTKLISWLSDQNFCVFGENSFVPFNHLESFEILLSVAGNEVGAFLEAMVPNTRSPQLSYSLAEEQSHMVFKNFSWPFRNWEGHRSLFKDVLGVDIFFDLVHAQATYARELQTLATDYFFEMTNIDSGNQKTILQKKFKSQLHASLATFCKNMGLKDCMLRLENHYKNLLIHNNEEIFDNLA
jgi:hypothetical protein